MVLDHRRRSRRQVPNLSVRMLQTYYVCSQIDFFDIRCSRQAVLEVRDGLPRDDKFQRQNILVRYLYYS